jgi:hypothetical protein
MTFWPRRRKIDRSIRSVGNLVATRFTPFDKSREMPADLTRYLGCGQEDFKTTKAVFVFVVGRRAVVVNVFVSERKTVIVSRGRGGSGKTAVQNVQ